MGVFETAKKVKRGDASAEERAGEFLEAVRKKDGKIRAFVEVHEEGALKKAKEIDAKAKRSERLGRLAGIVFSIKSNLCLKGRKATCSSKMLQEYAPPYTATAVQRLLDEDAIIIGATNMDEFACGSDTTHSAFFKTRNPLDEDRVPGGSSGGAAASVAAGFCDAALGTDTGGSIRCPASFCGVAGFKPSYGMVSRYGLIDMGMSLDQIGPLAKDAESAAQILSVIAGEDEYDPTTLGVKKKDFGLNAGKLRIGLPKEFFEGADSQVSKAVKDAAKRLEAKGASLHEVSIPSLEYAVPIYYLLNFAEFSSAMQKYDGLRYGERADVTKSLLEAVSEVRDKALGKEVKRRILLGTFITMKEFHEAWIGKTLKARAVLKKEFDHALSKSDVLLGPAMPALPWKIGEKISDPLEMYLSDILTVSANLAGIPAGVVSCAKIGRLSAGAQFHAKAFEDEKALAAMRLLEESNG